MLGTVQPLRWDLARLRQKIETVPGVEGDLRGIGFWNPLSIFAAFVLDGEDLARMLADVRDLHVDDRPVVEFLAPRAGYADTTTVNDSGVQALQTKRLPSIDGFDEARDFDARARYLLGFGLASIGRVDPAIGLMEESVRSDHPDPKFLIGLGNQYRAKGLTARAMRAYERALALAPGEAEASLHLAELQRGQGDDTGAEKSLRAGLVKSNEDAELAAAAARLLIDTGRPAEALPLLAAARAKTPNDGGLELLAGQALAAAGQRGEAGEALRRAMAADPDNAELQRGAADALLSLGDLDGAGAAYERASRIEPANAAAFVGLAETAQRRGDAAAARAARERALELEPYNARALALQGK